MTVQYEHIKDTFYYGILGDFKLVIDKRTDCFNVTKIIPIRNRNKRIDQWLRYNKYILFDKHYKQSKTYSKYVVDGNKRDETTGIFICKELLLAYTQWVSVEMYAKCFKIVMSYSESSQCRNQQTRIDQLVEENERLKSLLQQTRIDQLVVENERLKALITPKSEDRAVPVAPIPMYAWQMPTWQRKLN